jgi:hypothetical protein
VHFWTEFWRFGLTLNEEQISQIVENDKNQGSKWTRWKGFFCAQESVAVSCEPYSLRVKVRCGGHENLFLLEIRIVPKGAVEAADADYGSTQPHCKAF